MVGVLGHPGGEGQRCGSGERDAEFVNGLFFPTVGAHISCLKHPVAIEGARGYRIPLPPPLGSQVCTRHLSLLIKTGSSSSVLCDLPVSLKVKRVSSGGSHQVGGEGFSRRHLSWPPPVLSQDSEVPVLGLAQDLPLFW